MHYQDIRSVTLRLRGSNLSSAWHLIAVPSPPAQWPSPNNTLKTRVQLTLVGYTSAIVRFPVFGEGTASSIDL